MTPQTWEQIKRLFDAAVAEEPANRPAFLTKECRGDSSLQQQVESLLASHQQIGDFLQLPPLEAASDDTHESAQEPCIDRLIGAYRLVREIGRGGMGTVYLAERDDNEFEKQVAIKLVNRGMDTDSIVRRFRNERAILAMLDHPNIARLMDGGTSEDGLPYFVMEFIEGKQICEYCDDRQDSIDRRLAIFRIICDAVQHAHANRIVHRDLKPSNILVTAAGVPKLLDFGIAKILDADASSPTATVTISVLRLMTPEYASPEQIRSEPVTSATDIYSLGVLLYELLTGRRPYQFKSPLPDDIADVICRVEPEKPSTASYRVEDIIDRRGKLRKTVTPEIAGKARSTTAQALRRRLKGDLDNIALKALQKYPALRYATVQELSEDIRRHLDGSPIIARSARIPYRAGKFLRRNRARLGGLTALMLLFAAAVLASRQWPLRNRVNVADAIAVLPLQNISGDPAQDYFADGMTDELINKLARIGTLRVISRTSTMPYKAIHKSLPEIAQELGVDKIVEGSVLRSGDRVRITAQLIHGPTDRHLWARSYERNISDVLSLQSEVAGEIAREIKIAVGPADKAQLAASRTVKPEVYELFLKGQYEYNQGTVDAIGKAIEYQKEAIAKDPTYAPAYAALNEGYMWLDDYHVVPERDIRGPAKLAALRAVELDEMLPEAHAALGHFYIHDWNWPGAEKEFKRALELNPSYATGTWLYGNYLRTLGRLDEALEQGLRVRQLDPLSLRARSATIKNLYVARDYDAALREAKNLQEIYPNATALPRHFGEIYSATGEYDKAIAALRNDPGLRRGHPMALARLGYAYGKSGATRDAMKILEDLNNTDARRPVPAEIAYVYLGLGNKDRAFEWIEKAFALKSEWLAHTKFDPVFDLLRSDPRFTILLVRIGIPP